MKVLSSPSFAVQRPTRQAASAPPARSATPASSARSGWLLHNGMRIDTVEKFMAEVTKLGNSKYTSWKERIQKIATDLLNNDTLHLMIEDEKLLSADKTRIRRSMRKVEVSEAIIEEFHQGGN